MKHFFASIFLLMANSSFAQGMTFIPYLQMAYATFPGIGCSVRFEKANVGLQLDANLGTVQTAGVEEATLSALFYPSGRWNVGVGGGMGRWFSGNIHGSSPVFPMFAGYQGKNHFFSVSLQPLSSVSWQQWLPSVKYGWCF